MSTRPSVPGLRRPPDALIPGAPAPEPAPPPPVQEERPAPYRGEKLTLYLSDQEVLEIQAYLLDLRYRGVRIDRSRFFRTAMEMALADRKKFEALVKRGVGA